MISFNEKLDPSEGFKGKERQPNHWVEDRDEDGYRYGRRRGVKNFSSFGHEQGSPSLNVRFAGGTKAQHYALLRRSEHFINSSKTDSNSNMCLISFSDST